MDKKGTILLIEDDEVLSDVYQTKFELEDYEVVVAKDGVEGQDKVASSKPDMILLDLVMPKMNGFEFLEFLRGSRKTRDVPVLVLSNLGQDFEIERAEELGAVDFLVKAKVTPREVVEKVKELLAKGK